jgi:hypothetical protein
MHMLGREKPVRLSDVLQCGSGHLGRQKARAGNTARHSDGRAVFKEGMTMLKTEMDFRTEVKVEINPFAKNKYVEAVKVGVSYDVELEYRSWGIKGFCPILQSEVTVDYLERDSNDDDIEVEKSIVVKPNDLKREWIKSTDGIGMPESMDLILKEDGSVDYENSSITFWYCEP